MKAGRHHLYDELEAKTNILSENEGLEDEFEKSLRMGSTIARKQKLVQSNSKDLKKVK